MSNERVPPTHDILVVIDNRWHVCGVAWPLRGDDSGLVLHLNPLLDLSRLPETAKLVVKPRGTGKRSDTKGRRPQPRGVDFPEDDFGSDDIPF